MTPERLLDGTRIELLSVMKAHAAPQGKPPCILSPIFPIRGERRLDFEIRREFDERLGDVDVKRIHTQTRLEGTTDGDIRAGADNQFMRLLTIAFRAALTTRTQQKKRQT